MPQKAEGQYFTMRLQLYSRFISKAILIAQKVVYNFKMAFELFQDNKHLK